MLRHAIDAAPLPLMLRYVATLMSLIRRCLLRYALLH